MHILHSETDLVKVAFCLVLSHVGAVLGDQLIEVAFHELKSESKDA